MTKFQLLLKSRTFWTLVLMFATDAVSVYGQLLSASQLMFVNLILTSLAAYFKTNPSQNYNSPEVQALPVSPKQ